MTNLSNFQVINELLNARGQGTTLVTYLVPSGYQL